MRAAVGRSGKGFELKPEGTPQTFFVRSGEAAKQLELWLGKVVRVKGKITAEAPRLELELTEVGPAGG